MSVPDELVEVAARRIVWEQTQGCVTWEDSDDTATTGDDVTRRRALQLARAVLSAVSEAGWMRRSDARSVTDDLFAAKARALAERDEARAQAEALAEKGQAASDAMRLYNQGGLSWRELDAIFARLDTALRAFRESKETGDVR